MHFFTDGWTTTLNVYSQVGLVTLVGLIAKKRHPHRRVREQAAGGGAGQDRRNPQRCDDPAQAGVDDQRRHGLRALSAHAGDRTGARPGTASAWCWWRAWPSGRSSRCSSCRRSTCSSPRTIARTQPSAPVGAAGRTVRLAPHWVVRQTSQRRVPFGIEHNRRRQVLGTQTGRALVVAGRSASYQRKCEDQGAWRA